MKKSITWTTYVNNKTRTITRHEQPWLSPRTYGNFYAWYHKLQAYNPEPRQIYEPEEYWLNLKFIKYYNNS